MSHQSTPTSQTATWLAAAALVMSVVASIVLIIVTYLNPAAWTRFVDAVTTVRGALGRFYAVIHTKRQLIRGDRLLDIRRPTFVPDTKTL